MQKIIPFLFILVIFFFIGVIATSILSLTDEPQVIITECAEPKPCPKLDPPEPCPFCPDWPGCPAQEMCITYDQEYEDASVENETLMTEMSKVKTELSIVRNALEVVCQSAKNHVLCL